MTNSKPVKIAHCRPQTVITGGTIAIPEDLLDALMKEDKNSEDLIGETGLLKQLTKQLLERAMQAEMTEHLYISMIQQSPLLVEV